MKWIALVLCVALPVYAAEDAPRMERAAPGYVVTSPGWYLNDAGYVKLKEKTDALQRDKTECKVENVELQKRTDAAGGVPLWVAGAAVVVSLLVGAGVVALTKR